MARKDRKAARRRKSPVGCLVWLSLVLIIAVVFLAARASIAKAIDGSGLAQLLGAGKQTEQQAAPAAAPHSPPTVQAPEGVVPSDTASRPAAPAPAVSAPTATTAKEPAPKASDAPPQGSSTGTPKKAPPAVTKQSTPPARAPAPELPPATQTRQSTLYFVRVDDQGKLTVSGLPRPVSFTDAPLTQTLEALVAGPLAGERSRGYRSLIPSATRIEEIHVEGRTAFISFNEPFRFNPYGRDGLLAQLQQVVYTCTEFGNVDRVQIMIGGKVTDFLGPEGIRIRDPLSRESFTDGR